MCILIQNLNPYFPLQALDEAEREMRPADDLVLPTRILHLPLAFNERWTHDAINRYMRSVRSEAPYLPSNVEFIAKNNGELGAYFVACQLCAGVKYKWPAAC